MGFSISRKSLDFSSAGQLKKMIDYLL